MECQSPLFLTMEIGEAPDRQVHLFFSAPREAPTTRGFAGVLLEGLDGLPAAEVLAVPDDVPDATDPLPPEAAPEADLAQRGLLGDPGRG